MALSTSPIRPASLPPRERFAPTYVPALMLKPAERSALRSLIGNTLESLYPLLTVVPIPAARKRIDEVTGREKFTPEPTLEEYVRKQRDLLEDILTPNLLRGVNRAMLDVGRLDRQQGTATLARFNDALSDGVKRDLVPVVWAGQLKEHAAAARAWNERYRTGFALRLRRASDRDDLATIALQKTAALKALRRSGGVPAETDLVIDLGYIRPGMPRESIDLIDALLIDLGKRKSWRTVTLLGGAFPPSIGELDTNVFHHLERTDYLLWQGLCRRLEVAKVPPPIFGDYAMVNAVPPSGGTNPIPNLRYTDKQNWIVFRRAEEPAMPTICKVMTGGPWFLGSDFSRGDEWMAKVARDDETPGNAEVWIRTGLQHHLAYVLQQVQSF